MALQIWLPLDGSLRNLGLTNSNITTSGTTTFIAGKIGLGLSCPGNNYWIINNINLGTEVSICCWSKTTVSGKMPWVLLSDASNILNLYQSGVYTLNVGDGNSNPFKDNNNSNISVLADDKWHHFVVTFGNNVAKLYIDGTYRGKAATFRNPTTTNKTIQLAGGYNGGHSYDWNGCLNDFRVYDHCLSPKEVKEISKGLILHYPFDENFNTNLIKNGFGELGTENWTNTSSSNISTTDIPSGVSNIKASFSNNSTKEFIRVYPNSKYLFSIYIKSSATSGTTYPSLITYDIDKLEVQYRHVVFNANTLTTLTQALNPGDTLIKVASLANWNANSGHYYNYAALFSYKDSTGYEYPELVYTRNVPAFGTGTNAKTNLDKTNNIITLNSAYTGPVLPIGTKVAASTAGSTYYYPVGGIACSSILNWTLKTTIFTMDDARLKPTAYVQFYTYSNNQCAGISLTWLNTDDKILDVSGYGYDGILNDTTAYTTPDTPRYMASLYHNQATNSATYLAKCNCDVPSLDHITFTWWMKPTGWGQANSGLWSTSANGAATDYSTTAANMRDGTFDCCNVSGTCVRLPFASFVVLNEWHHYALTYDGATLRSYKDGIQQTTIALTGALKAFTSIFPFYSKAGGVNRNVPGYISDFRVYCTTLSADDIKELYNTPAMVDSKQNLYGYEFVESTSSQINKTGVVDSFKFYEAALDMTKYDKNIYTELDGSHWLHIFHHNNPATARFASNDTFGIGVYKNVDMWYDVEGICSILSSWEFMVKLKTTSDATETKYRWVLNINPMSAVWADVKPGTVTYNTSSGYNSSTMGGMYYRNGSNLRMCIANGSSGNWFGGIGVWTVYEGGIPGYPNSTVTTGYVDLYVRIEPSTAIYNDGHITTNNLYEI